MRVCVLAFSNKYHVVRTHNSLCDPKPGLLEEKLCLWVRLRTNVWIKFRLGLGYHHHACITWLNVLWFDSLNHCVQTLSLFSKSSVFGLSCLNTLTNPCWKLQVYQHVICLRNPSTNWYKTCCFVKIGTCVPSVPSSVEIAQLVVASTSF